MVVCAALLRETVPVVSHSAHTPGQHSSKTDFWVGGDFKKHNFHFWEDKNAAY